MLLSVAVFIQQLHWLAPAAVMFGSAPCFLMVWWPTKLMTAVLPKRFYRRADDFLFSTYIRLVLFFFENCTGIEVVLYGDVDALLSTDKVENAVYISNHQSTVDWILGCSVALRRGALSRCRYVVKDGLKYFPLYGFYLSQHETVFIKRGGKFQAEKAERQLRRMVNHSFPMWMVVFPEGTRYNPDHREVIEKSQAYSRQQGIPELNHVLCPRAKATEVCVRELGSYAPYLFDLTIAYNNTRCPRTGRRTVSPGMPDFLSGYTRRVHIHISKVPMKDVPKDEQGLSQWLNQRFQLKEKLLTHFYTCHSQEEAGFPGEGRVVPLSLRSTFPSLLLWGGAFAACMAFRETRSLYWKTGLASLLVGLGWFAGIQNSCVETKDLAVISFLYLYCRICRKTQPVRPLPQIQIRLISQLPVGAGLGSSAAFSVCLAAVLLQLSQEITPPVGETPEQQGDCHSGKKSVQGWSEKDRLLINKWAFLGEKIIHGQPSGIDNSVSTFGGAIRFQNKVIDPVEKMPRIKILLINTKVPRSTKTLVANVRKRHDKFPEVMASLLEGLEGLAERSLKAYSTLCDKPACTAAYSELEELVDMNQQLLNTLGVGHPSLDTVVQVTAGHGLHTKLTGVGGVPTPY